MKYFIDTEFLEGIQNRPWPFNGRFGDWLLGPKKPTIDLISIGIVEQDHDTFSKRLGITDWTYHGREYYAVSKGFNLDEAWNRFQMKDNLPDSIAHGKVKEYWIRENVLKPIYKEWWLLENTYPDGFDKYNDFRLPEFKRLLKKYGKTNKQIAEEIKAFVNPQQNTDGIMTHIKKHNISGDYKSPDHGAMQPEFYAYYADYDWVVFCWLFGKMIDLPKGFPKYCIDLKQMLEAHNNFFAIDSTEEPGYPVQEKGKEHNALEDARWNRDLYNFLEMDFENHI